MSRSHVAAKAAPLSDAWAQASIDASTLGLVAGPRAIAAATSTAISPSVGQFLNAANAEYVLGGTPAGMRHFTSFGIPVFYTNDFTGCSAQAWVTPQNQIVIAYQGTTGGENLAINPAAFVTQLASDVVVWAGGTAPAEADALNFAKFVLGLAHAQGYSNSNIFVTGHSLGGIEAEYVAQHTGLGGVAFESTGIPGWSGQGSGANFVNVVTYGDPVGNYASDIKGEQPFAPAYARGGGSLRHYGGIVMVGNAADQTRLSNAVAQWGDGNPLHQAAVVTNLVGLLTDFHLPGTQAHDLGATLQPYSVLVDGLGNQSGPVLAVAGDSIPQLITDATAHGAWQPG